MLKRAAAVRAILVVILIVAMWIPESHARKSEQITLELLGSGNGLSSGIITCILQDRKGFMWFGTVNGLNRFDGYHFQVFRNDPAYAGSISENYVTALFEDSRSRMFVGTANGGVDYFDRRTRKFTCLLAPVVGSTTRNIIEDNQGRILATRGEDIYLIVHLNGKWSTSRMTMAKGFPKDENNVGITKLIIDDCNRMYVSYGREVFGLVEQSGRIIARRQLLPSDPIVAWSDLLYDSVHRRLLVLNGRNIISYRDSCLILGDTLVRGDVEEQCWGVDRKGDIWYLGRQGMTRIGMDGNPTVISSPDGTQQHFLNSKTHLYWDRNQNLWIGAVGYGIAKYNPGRNRFAHVLDGVSIHNLYAGANNELYVGNNTKIVRNADGTASVNQIRLPEQNNYAPSAGSNLWTIYSAHVSSYDLRTRIHRKFPVSLPELANNKEGLFNFDKQGRLWAVFIHSPYIAVYDTLRRSIATYKFPAARRRNGYQFVQGMIWDDSDRLWMNTEDGIFSFNATTKRWKHFAIGIKKGIAVNPPFICMCNDPAAPTEYLWIGTNGTGLWKVNKQTGSYAIFDQRSVILDNAVYGIVPDDHGYLWLSSGYGIARLDPATGMAETYDKSDGLQDNEFNWGAAAKGADGTIAFGGLYGINYFEPDEITPLPPPSVQLTGLKLFNRQVFPGQGDVRLKEDITYTHHLSLTYRENMMTFEFSGLEYQKARGLSYRYKLDGFDKDWVYAGKENTATYTNLDAGDYKFYVQGTYSGSKWSTGDAQLNISITPPWWKTSWFYLSVLALIAVTVYLLHRYRLTQLLKVERLRIQIAQDLHDEIGSTLSTLSIYTRILQQELPQASPNARQILDNIGQNASQVMDSVSDIVWSINTRYDDFGSIISRMREHASALFEHRDCTVHYTFDESLPELALPMHQRKELYLIYKEALNNISKYAGCSNVRICLTRFKEQIRLLIRDDGTGFVVASAHNGNGLNNMRERAAMLDGSISILSTLSEGTTIDLQFPIE